MRQVDVNTLYVETSEEGIIKDQETVQEQLLLCRDGMPNLLREPQISPQSVFTVEFMCNPDSADSEP